MLPVVERQGNGTESRAVRETAPDPSFAAGLPHNENERYGNEEHEIETTQVRGSPQKSEQEERSSPGFGRDGPRQENVVAEQQQTEEETGISPQDEEDPEDRSGQHNAGGQRAAGSRSREERTTGKIHRHDEKPPENGARQHEHAVARPEHPEEDRNPERKQGKPLRHRPGRAALPRGIELRKLRGKDEMGRIAAPGQTPRDVTVVRKLVRPGRVEVLMPGPDHQQLGDHEQQYRDDERLCPRGIFGWSCAPPVRHMRPYSVIVVAAAPLSRIRLTRVGQLAGRAA